MAQPTSSASLLYQSLANSIDTAKGTILLYLNQGSWKTNLSGQDIFWTVPLGCMAEVVFDYGGAFVLNSLSVTFTPPIRADVPGFGGVLISTVVYNRFGDATLATQMVPATAIVMTDPTKATVLGALSFELHTSALFTGVPFTRFNSATPVDGAGQPIAGPATLVSRVRFVPDAGSPALAVTFVDQSVIKFSDSTIDDAQFNNFVTVRKGTGFQFDEIDYLLDDSSISGSLNSFVAVVERGSFSTSTLFLQLQGGSTVSFDHVTFSKAAGGQIVVDAEQGTLSAAVTAGSNVILASGGNAGPSSLVFDSGCRVDIQGFSLSVKDGGATEIQVGGGSSMELNVHSGRIGIATNNFLMLSSGQLNATFSGTWNSQANPDAVADITLLEFSDVAGQVDLNASTNLGFNDAVVKSDNLKFDSGAASKLTGAITNFSFSIMENSQIGIPGGFQMSAAAGGSFINTTPLQLKAGAPYPIGQYNLTIPFKRLVNGTAAMFSLTDGQALLSLESQDDGTIAGTNCSVQGTAVIVAATLQVSPSVHITGVNFQRPPAGDFTLNGTLQATVPQGLTIPVTTPAGVPDDDNHFMVFPLTLIGLMNQSLIVPPTAFRATNSVISLDPIALNPTFAVTIPGGLGEHEQWNDPNSAAADGEHHGDDDDKNRQEVMTFQKICTAHFYLIPGTYLFHSQLQISATNGKLDVNLTGFQSDRDISYHQDGCDGGILGAVLGVIVGSVFAGPTGAILGGIVGEHEGESFQEGLNHQIAAGVAAFLVNLRFDWHAII